MTHDPDFTDDLLARARRAPLSEAEERRLRELLASSAESRLLYEAGCAFDREAPVQAGDDARLERMLREVEKRSEPAPRRSQPQRLGRALATGLLLGTAAVAAVELGRAVLMPGHAGSVRPAAPPSESQAPRVPPAPQLGPAPAAPVREPADPSASATPASPAQPAPPHGSHAPIVALPLPPAAVGSAGFDALPPVPAVERATASQLFAEANRARVAGKLESAITTYRRLELEYPQSNEAVTARLSLGMLYLQTGAPGLALEQLQAYRAVSRGPALAEALFGEARALGRLGRREEERARLRELLEKFPRSAYAAAAEKRLAEP